MIRRIVAVILVLVMVLQIKHCNIMAQYSSEYNNVGVYIFGDISRAVEKTVSGKYMTTLSGKGDIKQHIALYGDSIIQEGITGLGDEVFRGEPSIDSIILPESLTVIGRRSFEECPNIKEIIIPANVTSVGKDPFGGCQRLKKIVNNSKVSIDAPRFIQYSYSRAYDYYVDGKPAKKVGPGKTMIGKPHKYKLKLELDGGKFAGKKMKGLSH